MMGPTVTRSLPKELSVHSWTPDPANCRSGTVRLFNGAAALFVPEFLLRRLGTDPEMDSSGVYPFRMFGIRTVLLGADLLLLQGERRRSATRLAVLIHGTDTVSAATAGCQGDLPRKAAIMTTMISAGNTVLALAATRENRTSEPTDELAHNRINGCADQGRKQHRGHRSSGPRTYRSPQRSTS